MTGPHTPAPACEDYRLSGNPFGTGLSEPRLVKTTPVEGAGEPMFLLLKRGLYYRPGSKGYTGIKDHAGRYSKAEAEAQADPACGVAMIAEVEAPDFAPKCFDDLARAHLEAKLSATQAALSASREREAAARDGLAAIDHLGPDVGPVTAQTYKHGFDQGYACAGRIARAVIAALDRHADGD